MHARPARGGDCLKGYQHLNIPSILNMHLTQTYPHTVSAKNMIQDDIH